MLADELNAIGALPDVKAEVATVDGVALDDIEVYVDEHPEGAKRGGYVPFATNGDEEAMWDHVSEEWVQDDEEDE